MKKQTSNVYSVARTLLFAALTFSSIQSAAYALQGQVPPMATPAAAVPTSSWLWEDQIRAYEEADKINPPPQNAIVFVGASGIRKWHSLQQDFPDYTVLNRGFGGSQMVDSVHYADRIVIPYHPKLIVVQAGGNDLASGKSPQQVLADFKAFVQKVRAALPKTRIAFLSVNPSPERWALAARQQETNRLVKEYINIGSGLDYINFWDAMVGPDGKPRADLFCDRLHNNAVGYKIRAAVVRSHLGPSDHKPVLGIASHVQQAK